MLATLFLAASSMAIPFGSGPDRAPSTDTRAPSQRYEMGFQFAEQPSGYRLDAVVFDQVTGRRSITPISRCSTIDIDSFTETNFGTPVICNGVTYVLDIYGRAIVAAPIDGGSAVELQELAPGRAYVNGMPLLIEAGR